MIDAKELMIGNWVYDGDKTQFPMFIVGLFDDCVYKPRLSGRPP